MWMLLKSIIKKSLSNYLPLALFIATRQILALGEFRCFLHTAEDAVSVTDINYQVKWLAPLCNSGGRSWDWNQGFPGSHIRSYTITVSQPTVQTGCFQAGYQRPARGKQTMGITSEKLDLFLSDSKFMILASSLMVVTYTMKKPTNKFMRQRGGRATQILGRDFLAICPLSDIF